MDTVLRRVQARRISRRQWLARAAATSTLWAAPMILPRRVWGASERIQLGFIGCKNRGMQNLEGFGIVGRQAGQWAVDCAALCDVDAKVLAAAARTVEKAARPPSTFGDWRRLLERKDLDAVVISVPDHWHALMTIEACRAGKDVYCEKPLTLFVTEGRKMVEVARQTGRVVQTGSQQRSDSRFRLACELARNGKLGKLHTILVGIPRPNHATQAVPDSDPPPELDYDMWLGPAPWRPYNVNRVHYNFRFFWDYSGGQMTNFGAHHLDIAQWALGMDDSGPLAIEGTGTFPPQKELCEVTDTCRVTFQYPEGVKVVLGQQQPDIPDQVTLIGDRGRVHVTRSRITSDPPELVKTELGGSDIRLYASANHYQNFLDCIRSRQRPVADVEIGHRTATVCHLGNIAIRVGRKITWDPVREQIVGDAEAAAMLSRPYRAPWKLA